MKEKLMHDRSPSGRARLACRLGLLAIPTILGIGAAWVNVGSRAESTALAAANPAVGRGSDEDRGLGHLPVEQRQAARAQQDAARSKKVPPGAYAENPDAPPKLPAADKGSAADIKVIKDLFPGLAAQNMRAIAVPVSANEPAAARSAKADAQKAVVRSRLEGVWSKNRLATKVSAAERYLDAEAKKEGYGGFDDVRVSDVNWLPVEVADDHASVVGSLTARIGFKQRPTKLYTAPLDKDGYTVLSPEKIVFRLVWEDGAWKLDLFQRTRPDNG